VAVSVIRSRERSPHRDLGHSFLKSGHATQLHPKKFSPETIRLTASHFRSAIREWKATSLASRCDQCLLPAEADMRL
jgi:hypothetical protein